MNLSSLQRCKISPQNPFFSGGGRENFLREKGNVWKCYIYFAQKTCQCQTRIRKGRGTRDNTINIYSTGYLSIPKMIIRSYFVDYYSKAFDCVEDEKLWIIIKEIAVPHLINLLYYLQSGQEDKYQDRIHRYCFPLTEVSDKGVFYLLFCSIYT